MSERRAYTTRLTITTWERFFFFWRIDFTELYTVKTSSLSMADAKEDARAFAAKSLKRKRGIVSVKIEDVEEPRLVPLPPLERIAELEERLREIEGHGPQDREKGR